jgi:hypothetical protein
MPQTAVKMAQPISPSKPNHIAEADPGQHALQKGRTDDADRNAPYGPPGRIQQFGPCRPSDAHRNVGSRLQRPASRGMNHRCQDYAQEYLDHGTRKAEA